MPRILVIDEVDVFCSTAFFGGAYCPSLSIKGNEPAALIRHIWSMRKLALDMALLKRHDSYQGGRRPPDCILRPRALGSLDHLSQHR